MPKSTHQCDPPCYHLIGCLVQFLFQKMVFILGFLSKIGVHPWFLSKNCVHPWFLSKIGVHPWCLSENRVPSNPRVDQQFPMENVFFFIGGRCPFSDPPVSNRHGAMAVPTAPVVYYCYYCSI